VDQISKYISDFKIRPFSNPRRNQGAMTWSSIRVWSEASPKKWYNYNGDGSMVLKDTRQIDGLYTNKLINPNTFTYELPCNPRYGEVAVVHFMKTQSLVHDETQRKDVRIIAVCNARNHYLGEFVVQGFTPPMYPRNPYVTLKRKLIQSDAIRDAMRMTNAMRSKSEAQHVQEIEVLFPPSEWIVEHEPEAAVNLDVPLVVDGEMREYAGDNYTVDFVVSGRTGCRRVCVESKCRESDIIGVESAMIKCRQLRDKTLCRVLCVHGHGEQLGWYDFGPPQQAKERAYSVHEIEFLRAELAL
jgi:hypothetical protein